MKKILIASLFMLPFYSVCFSQGQQPVPSPLLVPVIEAKEDASVTASFDKAEYPGAEAVKLNITLKNTGGKPFEIFATDAASLYVISVIGPDGQKLSKKPRRRTTIGQNQNLFVSLAGEPVRPQQTLKGVVWLSNLFDMSEPGSYKVTVSTTFRLGTGGDKSVDVGSEPLTVKVTSAPPISEWVN